MPVSAQTSIPRPHTPPRVAQAERFLARRGMAPGMSPVQRPMVSHRPARPMAAAGANAWQPLGPVNVLSSSYGVVTGRVTSIAFDPSDATGNKVYIGTTGGGVWGSQNAGTADTSDITFSPLTDSVNDDNGTSGAVDASISIGAVTVQPGGTGVVLAGTGDPNDALDSYYGAGILRSMDGGTTWSLIQQTQDAEDGTGLANYGFWGMGFAGFAWSTTSANTVVAAVSQAYEGTLVDAVWDGTSMAGLYYSNDAGESWHLARITDPSGQDVQGPTDAVNNAGGNPATSVVWNKVRGLFIAAVRYHGYYSSPDGVAWTRLAAQPGANLSAQLCPANTGQPGSPDCPIFRGTLAVNPQTGDIFAWTVDLDNQDQGLWQDVCSASNGGCANANINFSKQWSTSALETNTEQGAQTIENGDYNLSLAAVPSSQDTLLLAGANDLWKCSLAVGCTWRNTTNAFTCMSAAVGPYQHAVVWNVANPLEVLVGNDSGLWRSTDDVGETGSACASTDASHFQNLNSSIGSLTEVESMSQVGATPYTMMVGLGVNGTAGVKSTSGPTAQWPEILSGEGGPVAIDPSNPNNWYVNNGAGVSIHVCSQSAPCTQGDFGSSPVVNDADVGNDGLTMTSPAPFLVDSADPTQLLIATCRVWRGPAGGSGWSSSNAISPIFGNGSGSCGSGALIRSIAALPLKGGGEVVYVGMYGALDGGAPMQGNVFSATLNANGVWSSWTNLTQNPVTNDLQAMNAYGLDISSLYVDPADTTGNTVYATVAGMPSVQESISTIYRSTDGGAHWSVVMSNLPFAPANSVVVDPIDLSTVYVATDVGVYATQKIADCATAGSACWQPMGSGLPTSPVVALSATPATGSPSTLVAGTYGRGLWQIPLLTAGEQLATASVSTNSLAFGNQAVSTESNPQTITVTNTSGVGLSPAVSVSGSGFTETDNCNGQQILAGSTCQVNVVFAPTTLGAATGQITIAGNISGGSLAVALSGTGIAQGPFSITPNVYNFGAQEVSTTSAAEPFTVQNTGAQAVPITSITVSGPFTLASNGCVTSLAASAACALSVQFAPTGAGVASGSITVVDGDGTQTVALSGTGTSLPTDALSATSLAFPGTIEGQTSAAQTVMLTNSGGNRLTDISIRISGPFTYASTCTTQLAAGANCPINVSFAPTAVGPVTGTLTMIDILSATGHTVSLSGTGLAPPVISPSPASLNFGAQQTGQSSAAQTVTITNSGGAPMANVGFQIIGASASNFAYSSNTCGATLANGASCSVKVTFRPASTGGASAALAVSSSTLGVASVSVSLNGNGQGIGLNVNPMQLSFPAEAIGQSSVAQMVTLTNTSSNNASGLVFSASGPFSLTANACGNSLAAGARCTVGVLFTPMSNGPLTGQLLISSAAISSSATVVLNGIGGLSGSIQALPGSLSFPTTGVGATSGAQTVSISNAGPALANLALSASAGFTLTGSTCGQSLASGASCTVSVAFAPTAAGAQAGSLTIASSTLTAPATVPLAGIGFDFTVAISGSSTMSVASGQTASYTLTLQPLGGVGGSFSFQCGSSLPQAAACVFNPTISTVAANTTGTAAVSITTGTSTSAFVPVEGHFRAWLLLGGLLLLPLARWRKSSAFLLVAALAIAVGAFTSCASAKAIDGGGAPGGSGGSSTPAGTYTVPVTAISNGIQHSVNFTLVVD